MKNSIFLILIFTSLFSYAQGERTLIYGNIECEGAELENIHIYNKNSNKGTITNKEGAFYIDVQKKDTLIVTGVQFHYAEVTITSSHIQNKNIRIDLLQKMNELEEVEVSHNLTGNLSVDSDEIKIANNVKGDALNFANLNLNLASTDINHASRAKTSSDEQLMPNMNPNLIAIAALILTPVIKEVSKIGATKRNIKKYDKAYQAKVIQAYEKLRTDYGDSFFTETLKIPENHIDEFIAICLQKGMGNLYADNKKIEIINMFLTESKIYLKQIENND